MTIEVNGYEYQVRAEGCYVRPARGKRGFLGDQLEPDTEEAGDIVRIYIKDSIGNWTEFPFLKEVWKDISDQWLEEFKAEFIDK